MRQPIILHGIYGHRLILGPGFVVHEQEGETRVNAGGDKFLVVETFDEIARAVDAMHVLEDDEAGKRVEKAGGPLNTHERCTDCNGIGHDGSNPCLSSLIDTLTRRH